MSQSAAIISATIAMLALIFAIFGASWLNQRNIQILLGINQRSTEKLLEQMGKHFDARFDTVMSEIRRLDQRIDALDQRLSERIDRLDQRLSERVIH